VIFNQLITNAKRKDSIIKTENSRNPSIGDDSEQDSDVEEEEARMREYLFR